MRDNEITSEEIKEYVALEPVFNCYGQEKSLKMLEIQKAAAIERLKELGAEYDKLISFANKYGNTLDRTLTHMYSDKGGADPMVMGGIANAIAGPGAGAYAALKTQNENAAAQAANRELAINFHMLMQNAIFNNESAAKHKLEEIDEIQNKKIPEIEKKIETAKKTKITKIKKEDIEKHISLNFPNYGNIKIENLQEKDTLRVTVKIQWNESFFKQNYGSARIDGSFFANFYSGDYYIGSVKLVMPLFGVNGSGADIGGWGEKSKFFAPWVKVNKNDYDDEESYRKAHMRDISNARIRVVPNNLWVVDMNW